MRPYATLDVECFENWFLVGVTDHVSGHRWDIHAMAHFPFDAAALEALLRHYTIITFNGDHYDLLMVTAALMGWDVGQLKWLNDKIIKGGKRSWENRRELGLWTPDYIDHIDVMEVVPGVGIGLKVYAGRAHAPIMLDSPVDFEKPIPFEQIGHETYYCQNDREVTWIVATGVSERIALRIMLSQRYGVDLRSKSDAQIAEAVVKAEWQRRMQAMLDAGQTPPVPYSLDHQGRPEIIRRTIRDGYSFKYEAPSYIQFVSPHLQELLATAQSVDFVVRDKEQLVPVWVQKEEDTWVLEVPKIKTGVQMPKALHQIIRIGGKGYQMGIGGLHSRESSVSHYTTDTHQLRTADVASYYPSLMTTLGMTPEGLGPMFLDIYQDIKTERLAAKAAGDKTTDAGLKLVLNGSFGKLWSKYSIFFAPELGVRVTITGQLALLMLIERLTLAGIEVVSANTDGIEMRIPRGLEWMADATIKWWESVTGLTMECEDYISLHSRDVNNYIAVYPKGKVKRKGVYRPSGLVENKNPNMDICAEAVTNYLVDGTPIERTVRECRDIRQFVVVRKVKGGGYWRGQYLGSAVRWYYAHDGEPIVYANGNKVASSDKAWPLMQMDGTMPGNIDYQHYINVAFNMLVDVGAETIPF